jgi:hypothetical protein
MALQKRHLGNLEKQGRGEFFRPVVLEARFEEYMYSKRESLEDTLRHACFIPVGFLFLLVRQETEET